MANLYIVVLQNYNLYGRLIEERLGFYADCLYLGVAGSLESAERILKLKFAKIERDLETESFNDLSYHCYDNDGNFKGRGIIIAKFV